MAGEANHDLLGDEGCSSGRELPASARGTLVLGPRRGAARSRCLGPGRRPRSLGKRKVLWRPACPPRHPARVAAYYQQGLARVAPASGESRPELLRPPGSCVRQSLSPRQTAAGIRTAGVVVLAVDRAAALQAARRAL